jgi:centrosomal CEP192-like protein/ASPM-SPD-2-Hydin domain-containing protein
MRSGHRSSRVLAAVAVALAALTLGPAQGSTTAHTGVRSRAIKTAKVRFTDVTGHSRSLGSPGRLPVSPAGLVPSGVPVQRVGRAASEAPSAESPAMTASFAAVEDDDSVAPPDTTGAAGTDHVMAVTNARMRVQTKAGAVVDSAPFAAFWDPLGVTDPFGPRLVYEPYGGRWVLVAAAGRQSTTSSVLLAVSQTSDPSGLWSLSMFDADQNNATWADHPVVGFDRDRIVVQANMGRNDSNSALAGTKIWAIPKTTAYAGGIPAATVFFNAGQTLGNTQVPAVTYDPNLAVTYFLSDWKGGDGSLRLFSLQGAVGAETFTAGPFVAVADTWADNPPSGNDFVPQALSSRKIQAGDARIANVVYRNGSLWASHTVFLPAGGAPTRSAVQWWEIRPDATVIQRGRVDDLAGRHFAFPSIAVNANGDALLGFSTFSATSFAGAGYAFRFGTDPLSTMQADRVLKAGEAKYERGAQKNLWGASSATVTDPSNDRALWTLQEFAWMPNVLHDRWSTWWGQVISTAVPAYAVSPPSLAFGSQNVGTRSTERTVTVTNSGTANLVVQSISITGTHAADYGLVTDGCTNVRVAPGASCPIGVAFTPGAPEVRTATLGIATNAPGAAASVPISGTGTTPSGAVTFTPASIDFGSVEVSTTAPARHVTLSNNGTAPLVIGRVVIGGVAASEYTITSDACSASTLPVGSSCVVALNFTPAEAGNRSALLQVASNAPGGPHAASLTGLGTVAAPILTRTPTSLSFGTQSIGTTSAPKQISVRNTGNAPLNIGIASIAGNNAAEFIKTGDTCSNVSVAPGFSCDIAIAFAPAAGGTRTAGIAIPSNAAGSPHLIQMAGSGGGDAAKIELSPTSMGFGEVGVGLTSAAQPLTLTNIGSTSLVIGQLGFSGSTSTDYARTSDLCSVRQLSPGQSCTVNIVFAPSELGLRSAALTIPSNAGGSPHSVTLSGTGADRIAPTTAIMTKEGAVIIGGPLVLPSVQSVQGRTVDDLSGVKRVAVTFTPDAGAASTIVVSLNCGSTNRGCSWNVPAPLIPGRYTVTTEASDYAGNIEADGPSISVIVL